MTFNRSLWPRTLAARFVMLLLIGLSLSHAISLSVYNFDRGEIINLIGKAQLTERITTIASLILDASPEDQEKIVHFANVPNFRVSLAKNSNVELNDTVAAENFVSVFEEQNSFTTRPLVLAEIVYGDRSIWRHLTGQSVATHISITDHFEHIVNEVRTGALVRVSIKIADELWLNFEAPDFEATMPWSIRFVLSIAMMMIATVLLSIWGIHYLTYPLQQLNIAADRLGRGVTTRPMAEVGPLEVRQSAKIFNKMQANIIRFVEDRTKMIAAIAHDLRTPLMRMQLRSELLDDIELRNSFNNDIEEMNKIVTATLSFSTEENIRKENVQFDLTKLTADVVQDLQSIGLSAELHSTESLLVNGDPSSLRRALTNLIENAAVYGDYALISLSKDVDRYRVVIEDNGPGIPKEDLENVFKPFYRIDGSRNRETGGTGLGLAIARSVFRHHGGDIIIENKAGGGLKVEAILPK